LVAVQEMGVLAEVDLLADLVVVPQVQVTLQEQVLQ
jgi:hypothetical protein